MAAPKGNQYYKLQKTHGRELKYKSPKVLLKGIISYFQWCDENPWAKNEQLKNPIVNKNPDTGEREYTTLTQIPTTRPYTLTGLCVHLGIRLITWKEYCKRKAFANITSRASEMTATAGQSNADARSAPQCHLRSQGRRAS